MSDNNEQDPGQGGQESATEEATPLDAIATREAESRRRLYAQESDFHHMLTRSLIETAPNVADTLAHLHEVLVFEPEDVRYALDDAAIMHQQNLLNVYHAPASGGLIVKGAPYDYEWTARRDFGTPTAEKSEGKMELFASSVSRPYYLLGERSTWNGAGIGISFRPRARSTYVRVAPYLRYQYRWHNDSTLAVARNRGELGILVQEMGSGTTIVDSRVRLWNDGTSWYQTHSDERDDVYSGSTYFFANSAHEYAVWFWFNSSIDFSPRSPNPLDPASSRANNSLLAYLGFVVFEQWA